MRRIIAINLMICIMLFSLVSCTAYRNITFIERNDEKYLLYQGNEYYESSIFTTTEGNVLTNEPNENDVELGWYYSFPFSTRFYSDKSENPLYIYTTGSDRNFYLRQDYDYFTDTFVIENTNIQIVWEDIFGFEQSYFYFANPIRVALHSKQCPRISAYFDLVSVGDQWYLSFIGSQTVWTLSDQFIKILLQNGII